MKGLFWVAMVYRYIYDLFLKIDKVFLDGIKGHAADIVE
ncbi:Uncharacterised protein [Escherichia coli]|nr:Uncharacterised protein [Escherichia coli]